jgi:hypothetical protein
MRSLALFSYIYHEFITVLGDGFSLGQGMKATLGSAELRCFRLAKALTCGLIPTVYMEQVSLEPENKWQETVSRAFCSFCKPFAKFQEYLLFGSTCRPPEVECASQEVWHYMQSEEGEPLFADGRKAVKVKIQRPTVLTGTFKAEDGSLGTVIVNATEQPRNAKLKLSSKGGEAMLFDVSRTLEKRFANVPETVDISLEPLGVKMFIVRQ